MHGILHIKKEEVFKKMGNSYIFTELASELEEKIIAQQKAVGNFTTNGASVSGAQALIAMDRLTENVHRSTIATVYKGNIIKNLIMDCQSYTKYRPNETTGGIFVSWRRKEELPTGA